jgi:soluble lytic murein transglycosylase
MPVRWWNRWGALAGALFGAAALAQSSPLLEQVRAHDPKALQTATAERAACGQKTPCADSASLQLLTGYLALSSGDAVRARGILDSQPVTGPLAAFADYYRGEAAFYTRQFADAAKAYGQAAQEGPAWLKLKATRRQAEALVENGDFSLALPLLEGARDGGWGPELLWAHQTAARATGDLPAADADCHLLAVRFPRTPAGTDALALIGEGALTVSERISRAQAMVTGGAAHPALDALESLTRAKLPLTAQQRAGIALLRMQAYDALGDDKNAEHQALIAARGPAAIAAPAQLARANRRLKHDQHAQARAIFAKVESAYPHRPEAEIAGYFKGWIDLQDQKLTRAASELTAFASKYRHSRRRDDALWFAALAQIDHEAYAAARKTLAELVHRFPNSSLVPQALYWTHRCEQLEKAPPAALVKGYSEVIQGFPGSYYALLAATRIQELGATPPKAFPKPPQTVEVPPPERLSLAQALTQAGLFKDAATEISRQTARVKDRPTALALGQALQGIGNDGAAYAVAARALWGAAFHDRDPQALALMFPRAFQPLVEKEAKAQAVDPALMWAVMRRESAFDPTQVSGANARGLMQLIPPTAAAIAKRLKLDPPTADGLLVPSLNVKLSSWYLAALVKRFSHPVLCAAAYNAGPTAVVRWMKTSGELPLDLFVERIPYKETRGYVKQVVADLFNYRELYGSASHEGKLDASAQLSLTLPAPSEDGVQF